MARLTYTLLLLSFLLVVHLNGQEAVNSQRISVHYNDIPLREVLADLEKRYRFQFVYSEQFVSLSQKVTFSAINQPMGHVLNELFRNTGIEYRMMGQQVALRAAATPLSQPERLVQTVRGTVIDADSRMPLIGANIQLLGSSPFLGSSTNTAGRFNLPNVPVGRHNFMVTYLGYQPLTVRDMMVISGKELVLEIELQESTTQLAEVVVFSAIDKMQPLNDMITVSGRQFRVEEASRYPGSFQDPARMSRSFAGVSYIDDLENDLVIRGNPPTSLLWRLEGVEIPNPNHYHAIGNTGGAISMLNSSVLTTSDFLTGAFPAEYGNTISGAFDLRFRNGNNERPEYSTSVGVLGLEASAEGPLSYERGSSYLANYRYSSLALLELIGLNPVLEGGVPKYQDLSFKFHLPTPSSGTFSVFGLAGHNYIKREPKLLDNGRYDIDNTSVEEGVYGLLGIKHIYQLSELSYLTSAAVMSHNSFELDYAYFPDALAIENSDVEFFEKQQHIEQTLRLSLQYNHKFNAGQSLRAGLVYSLQHYDLLYYLKNERSGQSSTILNDKGLATTLQAYAQWKYRWQEQWSMNTGLHLLHFSLNGATSVEPRFGLNWKFAPNQSLRFGTGLHSYIGHVSSYVFHDLSDFEIQPFRDREFPKSIHLVLGYSLELSKDWHIRPEIYYQHLYDVAVSKDSAQTWVSALNLVSNYDIFNITGDEITNQGKGRNMGFELTMEKLFSEGYYSLLTASIYDSRYSTADGRTFSTLFNGNYIFNLLGGREFSINGNDALGINFKYIFAGGNRYSLIDEEASREAGYTIFIPGMVNSEKANAYQRADLLVSYTINNPRATHRISLDIQNLFNRRNVLDHYFDRTSRQITTDYQVRLLFDFRYKATF